jgi:hypothetical protein
VLEDDAGEQRFELTDGEHDAVVDLVAGEEFQREMGEPASWECSLLLDIETTVAVVWSDGTMQEALLSDGCFGRCDMPKHPFMALRSQLFKLKERYMAPPLCPPGSERYPEYCALAPEPPPPPESRMLCGVCLDDCGIPLPTGTPERGPVPST